MADAEVVEALRSPARLVVVEAPGGCGKTFQGASFAADICPTLAPGRMLVLTHTHAACGVFAERTRGLAGLEIRTIDSLLAEIADAYPMPGENSGARAESDFERCGRRAAAVLASRPFVAETLARRYPVVVCDEHQDASIEQHAVVSALHGAGARIRAFGDSMQRIHGMSSVPGAEEADAARWSAFMAGADVKGKLETPHRWSGSSSALGTWVLESRETLKRGGKLRLRGRLPDQVRVVVSDNVSPRNLGFRLDREGGKGVAAITGNGGPLLILSHHNQTVHAIRAALGRTMPIWEGNTRAALPLLASRLERPADALVVARAAVDFVQATCTGFSDSRFAARLLHEVASGCSSRARGNPLILQNLARLIAEEPDHRGVGKFLRALQVSAGARPGLAGVVIDYPREYLEAVRLGDAVDPRSGLAEIARDNTLRRRSVPRRAISTVHKAKGLEAENVLLMPCDGSTFREKDRRLLYVAISRATRSLTVVVSRTNPSPIIEI